VDPFVDLLAEAEFVLDALGHLIGELLVQVVDSRRYGSRAFAALSKGDLLALVDFGRFD